MWLQHKRYTFMHNGGITSFPCIKRAMLASLSDTAYRVSVRDYAQQCCLHICFKADFHFLHRCSAAIALDTQASFAWHSPSLASSLLTGLCCACACVCL